MMILELSLQIHNTYINGEIMNTYIKNMALVATLLGASAAYSMDGVCYAHEAEGALAEWEAFFDKDVSAYHQRIEAHQAAYPA